MKRIKYLIIIMLLFVGIKDIYAHTFDTTIKVYDYAQVLTEKEEEKIKNEVKSYINKNNIDMVLVTVKYYTQLNLKDYTREFYNRNNFGLNSDKSGIIMVLDLKNNDVDIEVFGNNQLYSEDKIKGIIEIIKDKDNYYDKIMGFINNIDGYEYNEDITYSNNNILKYINWLLIIIISISIPSIVIIIILLMDKKKNDIENINYYMDKSSVVINKKEDKFLTTNTKIINK